MSNINNFTVVGRLTKDAIQKQVGNSTVVEFTIANNTGFGQYACTNFIKVNAWGKQAQTVLQWLVKGKEVGVSGVFENKRWTDQNGSPRDNWVLTVQGAIIMMSDPHNASEEKEAPTSSAPEEQYPDEVTW